ncbi:H-type lectin domain-containing protein [Curtobacterium sp. Arg-1]|uniref:H-type lectin domain-containing protein n=1 Tax=Curtobacterium sp. Arg-1 TaxID=2935040 RepID=UPI0021D9DB35|nr:H-type lectin domain-containing protein [Curtobacterium sp. Arg-1]UXZ57100.1 H-type lectin domain-containing protein [Curtobacterium sp. Arg-1]
MNRAKQIGDLLFDIQEKVAQLGSSAQLANTTVGGEAAVPVADVVTESVVTNDALPDVQTDVADAGEGVSDLQSNIVAVMDDLVARLEDAAADLGIAAASLTDADQDVSDAFGLQLEGLSDRVDQIVVGAGGTLILFSDEGPDGTAPTGSTWFMINEAENIVGQWQQTGPEDAPVWTPRAIESSVIANLDVGKLTAGQAALAQVVAMKIAAATADIQTVNVGNLFVTQGATMQQAVIEYLFANVVAAKKITADMLDVNSLNGVSVTGLLLKTASTGQRLEILKTRIDVYGPTGGSPTSIQGFAADASFGQLQISGTTNNGSASCYFGGVFPVESASSDGTPGPLQLNVTASHGVGAPAGGFRQLYAYNPDAVSAYCVMDGSNLNNITLTSRRVRFRPAVSGAAPVDVIMPATEAAGESRPVVRAYDFRSPNGYSVVPLSGSVSYTGPLEAQTSDTITVDFPSGRFATAPTVIPTGSNSRVTVGINAISKDSVTFSVGNWTSGNAPSLTVRWVAIPTPA